MYNITMKTKSKTINLEKSKKPRNKMLNDILLSCKSGRMHSNFENRQKQKQNLIKLLREH